jgi:oxygen-independent coproporphyrinogen-3 oxidase
MEEFMFLGLRMTDGVAEEEFLKCFGIPVRQCYGAELDRLAREGLIKEEKGRISLTEKGVDYGNYVFSRFIRN